MKKTVRFLFILIFALCAVSVFAEDIVLESEVLKVVLHEQTGSFTMYRKMGKKQKFTPLNEASDNSSSSFFAVKTGNRFKPLRRSYDLTIKTVQNEDGSASLVWEDSAVSVEARFTLLATDEKAPADAIRVDLYVMNLSDADTVCSVKAVIDTVLGETSRIHFTTAKGTAIRSEKGWMTMTQDKWLSSSNGDGTVSFLFAGSAATDPDYVLAASREQLLSDTWKPVINEGRGFSTLQAPNNSAIGVWYKETKLKLFESSCQTFFITTAVDGEIPPNAVLLGIEAEPAPSVISESVAASAAKIVDQAVETAAETDNYVAEPAPQEKKVDYSYVQQLLDRIKEIENSENPDPDEIASLSAEIDAVILELTK